MSTYRQIPKKDMLYSLAVYIADPVNMLTQTQIQQYTDMARKHLKIDLPLCLSQDDVDDNKPLASDNQSYQWSDNLPVDESFKAFGRH